MMRSAFIGRLLLASGVSLNGLTMPFGLSRVIWAGVVHLSFMETDKALALGLDPLLTTSELADYLGVNVQAIYDLRCQRRAPLAIHVGRELRFRAREVRRWLDGLQDHADELELTTLQEVGER